MFRDLRVLLPVCLVVLSACAPGVPDQPGVQVVPGQKANIVYEVHHVESVDGALIRVEIKRDADIESQGVLLTYSPYNTLGETQTASDSLATAFNPLGVARAVADVIGTRGSTGCWDYGGKAEQQSGVDVVNYLASLPWSNGNVGMIGTSYDGTTANMVAAAAPEALKLVIPEAAISHWYGYAYRQGVRYTGNSENPTDEGFDTPLAFDFGFALTVAADPTGEHFVDTLRARAAECGKVEHTQRGYDRNPDYDQFWIDRDYAINAEDWRAAVLLTHGWNDLNVKQDEAIRLWKVLELDDPATPELDGVPDKRLFLSQERHSSASNFPDFVELRRDMIQAYLLDDPEAKARLDANPLRVTSMGDGVRRQAEDFPFVENESLDLFVNRFYTQDFNCVPVCVPGPGTGEIGTLELVNRFEGDDAMDQPGRWNTQAGWLDVPVTADEYTRRDPLNDGYGIGGDENPGGHGYVTLYFETPPLETDLEINGSIVLDGWFQKMTALDNAMVMPIVITVSPTGATRTIQRGFINLDYADGLERANPQSGWVNGRIEFLPSHTVVPAGYRIALVVQSNNQPWGLPGNPQGLMSIGFAPMEGLTDTGSVLHIPYRPADGAEIAPLPAPAPADEGAGNG